MKKTRNNFQLVEINTWSVIKVVLVLIGFYLLYLVRDIVLILFLVTILVSALTPMVEWLEGKKIPRLLSVILVFLGLVLFLTIIGLAVVPTMFGQMQQLVTELPIKLKNYIMANNTKLIIQNWQDWLIQAGLIDSFGKALEIIYQQVSSISASIISQTFGVFSALAVIFTIVVLTFYLLLEEGGYKSFLLHIIPTKQQLAVFNIFQKASIKTGNWLRGQFVISCCIFAMSLVGFTILGVKFPLVLAIIAGVCNIVPIIGPIIGGAIAIFVALLQSPWLALGVLILAVLIQQIDSQFITPKIMGKFVGLSPVAIIISLLIGATLGGIPGVALAIPIAATISVIVQEWNSVK